MDGAAGSDECRGAVELEVAVLQPVLAQVIEDVPEPARSMPGTVTSSTDISSHVAATSTTGYRPVLACGRGAGIAAVNTAKARANLGLTGN